MKRIWIALALLGMVVSICIGGRIYLHRQAEQMEAILDRLEVAYNEGDTVAAHRIAEEFAHRFRHIGRTLDSFVPHDPLSETRETAAMLPALIRSGGEEELRMELARLREQLRHLRDIDDPSMENIL